MKPKWIASAIGMLFGPVVVLPLVAAPEVTALVSYHDANTGLTILRGKVGLSVPGYWIATPEAAAGAGVSEVFLGSTPEAYTLLAGRRMTQRVQQDEIDQDKWPLTTLVWVIRSFSESHGGRQPKSLDELVELNQEFTPERRKEMDAKYHVLDDLRIESDQPLDKTRLLAFEITPLVDDGKHWVLLSNGTIERRAIDPQLALAHGVTIQPRRKAAPESSGQEDRQAEYSLHARVLAAKPTSIQLKNSLTAQTLSLLIEPEPVATLSMNLREEVWVKAGTKMLGAVGRRAGVDTTLLDFLGPDLHVAIADADPILEMGSGELTNAFGPMLDNSDMILLPTLVSMFTRPTALCIGLNDPAAARRALNQSVGRVADFEGGNEITGSLYKVAGRESWIYRISFFNMITLRLGIEVQDRYLVIRNMPLTTPFHITGMTAATEPGAQLRLSPRACRLQLPALFASAAERERAAAFGGICDLQPLLLTGSRSIEEAAAKHKAWFGFRPLHPAGGAWDWDGWQMKSDRYGTFRQPTQPDYQTGTRDFGLLRKVDGVEVGMRFESDGLRTTARWQLRR